jgi:hypothetical protein
MDEFLRHCDDDVLVTPEDLGDKLGISRALVHLVLQCGCPAEGGRISRHTFFEWLTEHYALVRAAAGLPPLEPIVETEAEDREKQKRGFLTVIQFTESRASLRATRDGARQVLDHIRQIW